MPPQSSCPLLSPPQNLPSAHTQREVSSVNSKETLSPLSKCCSDFPLCPGERGPHPSMVPQGPAPFLQVPLNCVPHCPPHSLHSSPTGLLLLLQIPEPSCLRAFALLECSSPAAPPQLSPRPSILCSGKNPVHRLKKCLHPCVTSYPLHRTGHHLNLIYSFLYLLWSFAPKECHPQERRNVVCLLLDSCPKNWPNHTVSS